jgi:hypothetical protein
MNRRRLNFSGARPSSLFMVITLWARVFLQHGHFSASPTFLSMSLLRVTPHGGRERINQSKGCRIIFHLVSHHNIDKKDARARRKQPTEELLTHLIFICALVCSFPLAICHCQRLRRQMAGDKNVSLMSLLVPRPYTVLRRGTAEHVAGVVHLLNFA